MEMCSAIGVNLQCGMNFRLRGIECVIVMSLRPGAPYADQVEDEGRMLIYEGHDVPRTVKGPHPKQVDQPGRNPGGSLTQKRAFCESCSEVQGGSGTARTSQSLRENTSSIWVYNGLFELIDCWTEQSGSRKVFKFKLQFSGADDRDRSTIAPPTLEDDRLIPSWVKLEVWKRDQGRCQKCGTTTGLHFDHIIYSKGGSSKDPANIQIQILCGSHNLSKRDNIE